MARFVTFGFGPSLPLNAGLALTTVGAQAIPPTTRTDDDAHFAAALKKSDKTCLRINGTSLEEPMPLSIRDQPCADVIIERKIVWSNMLSAGSL